MSAPINPGISAESPVPEMETPAFGLYIHWPFCAAKCPYCDFNSHVVRQVDQEDFVRLLINEMRFLRGETGQRPLNTLFFGGGTPSLMAGRSVAALLDEANRLWPFDCDIEVTLEANPSSADAARFADYRAAGVNRLSLGVQSLREEELRRLGRLHTVSEAKEAIALASRHFERASFDLIYARPGQSATDWEDELSEALALGPSHLSLYQLTFEEGTPFDALRRAGKMVPLEDDLCADLFDLTQDRTEAAGLAAYETSNHARPGQASRHNLIYWRMHDYVGIGPGAHGRFTQDGARWATVCRSDPRAWAGAVETDGHGLLTRDPVPAEDQATELMLMGLRLAEGVSLQRYEGLAGAPLEPARIAALEGEGLLVLANGRLTVTGKGRPLLNTVLSHLLA